MTRINIWLYNTRITSYKNGTGMNIAIKGNDTKNDTQFTCYIEQDTVIEIIHLFERGLDNTANELLDTTLDHIQRKVVDAMAWVDFDAIALMARGTRFAVKHDDFEFGVGRNLYQAHIALSQEEF